MKFILTYRISQGPNSANIILEQHAVQFGFMSFCTHTHTYTANQNYSFLLKDKETTCNQITNSTYHKGKATWTLNNMEKTTLDFSGAIHQFSVQHIGA